MSRRNADYWRERYKLVEEASYKKAVECNKRLAEIYKSAERSVVKDIESWYARFADDNKISIAEARRLLGTKELEEFRWDVNEYIRIGEQAQNLSAEWQKKLRNASAKVHVSRLEAIQLQIQQQAEMLYSNQLDTMDKHLGDVLSDGYLRSHFTAMKGLGIGYDFTKLDTDTIEKLLKKPWTADGRTFTDRCWQGKQELLNGIQTDMLQGMLRGDDMRKVRDNVAQRFGVSQYKAGRLVYTETSYFNSLAKKKHYEELGVKEVEIVETLDSRTCSYCGSMDGKVVPLSEYSPGITVPPFHPNCRGTTAPAEEDGELESIGERIARGADGKTYYVPQNMTYEQWLKQRETLENGGTPSPHAENVVHTIVQTAVNSADDWEDRLRAQTEDSLGSFVDQLWEVATDEEIEALRVWTTAQYGRINRYLRYGGWITNDLKAAVRNIESVLDKCTVPEEIIVCRGTGTAEIFRDVVGNWENDASALIGHEFSDAGFVASSVFEDGSFCPTGNGRAELFIRVPKGAHGAYIEQVSYVDIEAEFLLQRGYSYRIIKAEYRDSAIYQNRKDLKVWCEVILDE